MGKHKELKLAILSIVLICVCTNYAVAGTVRGSPNEVSVGYAHVNQDLFSTIKFDMPTLLIGYTRWYNNFGVRGQLGRSMWVDNTLNTVPPYGARIRYLHSVTLMYRVPLDNVHIQFGVGKTDYKTDWTVNGVQPSWSGGSDSDWSYHVELMYSISSSISVGVEYADIYRKNKVGYGKETTDYTAIKLIYKY